MWYSAKQGENSLQTKKAETVLDMIGAQDSIRSLIWALVLLAIIIYVFVWGSGVRTSECLEGSLTGATRVADESWMYHGCIMVPGRSIQQCFYGRGLVPAVLGAEAIFLTANAWNPV